MSIQRIHLADEAATLALGREVAEAYLSYCVEAMPLQSAIMIYLEGELGAGKTTFTRGFLAAFSYTGNVKSPTYTLVEPYALAGQNIYHFDLYRLADPEELVFLGVDEYFAAPAPTEAAACLLEWPSRGGDCLPEADLRVALSVDGEQRIAELSGVTGRGQALMDRLRPALVKAL